MYLSLSTFKLGLVPLLFTFLFQASAQFSTQNIDVINTPIAELQNADRAAKILQDTAKAATKNK
jgi:hypothetical protein